MNVSALLESSVHSGDQVDLLFESLQRLQGGCELAERFDAKIRILLAKRFP